MTTYTYSIDDDFTAATTIDTTKFNYEIEDDGTITPECTGINMPDTSGDVVEITFASALSPEEKTRLDFLASVHVIDNSKPRIKFLSFSPNTIETNSTVYMKVARFPYPGSRKIGDIDYIDIIANMEPGVTSYDMKVVDFNDRSVIIAEATGLTNTTEAAVSLGTINNVPKNSTLLELYVRKTGGDESDSVDLEEIIVYYGN